MYVTGYLFTFYLKKYKSLFTTNIKFTIKNRGFYFSEIGINFLAIGLARLQTNFISVLYLIFDFFSERHLYVLKMFWFCCFIQHLGIKRINGAVHEHVLFFLKHLFFNFFPLTAYINTAMKEVSLFYFF